MNLHAYLEQATACHPDRTAVAEPSGRSIRYAELAELSSRLSGRLRQAGIGPGDRVGLYLHKSIDSVAAIFGILGAGAAYVPVDPTAPASRNAYIFGDCSVAAIVLEGQFEDGLREAMGSQTAPPELLVLPEIGGGEGLRQLLPSPGRSAAPDVGEPAASDEDLAYILYTSGSTGQPKGVMISQRNAVSFVDWCSRTFQPSPEDRFSSHAPFHFDLSILDIYTAIKHGACLVLIPEELGKQPTELARFIAESGISVWYSTPSILRLLTRYGRLEDHDYSPLRLVCFAGEVFPIGQLRELVQALPRPRYLNLYGPTETNVCTFHELQFEIPAERSEPLPIGKVCAHVEGLVVDGEGEPVGQGMEGELCIRGDSVTQGYWNLGEQTAQAFLDRNDGAPWYRTGDLVVENTDGEYAYRGRRDRMVKKRGYRVELGEIESALYRHEKVGEAAVVAVRDEEDELQIVAHLATPDGEPVSPLQLKAFCSRVLPRYMIPDVFRFHAELPKTSTDKTDYQKLLKVD